MNKSLGNNKILKEMQKFEAFQSKSSNFFLPGTDIYEFRQSLSEHF